MGTKYVSNNVWRDFRHLVSAFATVALKSFNGQIPATIDFLIRHFMLHTTSLKGAQNMADKKTKALKGLHKMSNLSKAMGEEEIRESFQIQPSSV